MNELLHKRFPSFASRLRALPEHDIENVEPPASEDDIQSIEADLGLSLPEAYKDFLRCTRGFWIFGGVIQFGIQHPFFHDFPPEGELSARQLEVVRRKGGTWPPPSQGMLCFAEFFMEADGDQVLFDVSNGLVDGEYPIMYYAHEAHPPSVRKLSDSFERWLNQFLDYPEFEQE